MAANDDDVAGGARQERRLAARLHCSTLTSMAPERSEVGGVRTNKAGALLRFTPAPYQEPVGIARLALPLPLPP